MQCVYILCLNKCPVQCNPTYAIKGYAQLCNSQVQSTVWNLNIVAGTLNATGGFLLSTSSWLPWDDCLTRSVVPQRCGVSSLLRQKMFAADGPLKAAVGGSTSAPRPCERAVESRGLRSQPAHNSRVHHPSDREPELRIKDVQKS